MCLDARVSGYLDLKLINLSLFARKSARYMSQRDKLISLNLINRRIGSLMEHIINQIKYCNYGGNPTNKQIFECILTFPSVLDHFQAIKKL